MPYFLYLDGRIQNGDILDAMNMSRYYCQFLILLVLSCADQTAVIEQPIPSTQTSASTNAKTYVYQCNKSYQFVARLENNNVWLFLPGQIHALPRVTSASGAKYTNGTITFWSKGEEALLQTPSQTYRNCKNNRRAAIWEHAKLNGVNFRATGNEPGWHLEITQGQNILFVTNYGQNRYTFQTPESETFPDQAQTIYQAQNSRDKLTIVLEGKRCRDTMADESYSTTVTVTLNDKTYRGCGRPLH